MEYVPGVQVARTLFRHGLWFDAVVRGLMAEIGLTEEQAKDAARVALAERIAAESPAASTG
jgi:hypothetical protein